MIIQIVSSNVFIIENICYTNDEQTVMHGYSKKNTQILINSCALE